MIDLRSNSIIFRIFVFFWFGVFVSGGFVSRGRSQTPAQNGGKDRFDDGSSSRGHLIDNALRALSRHWLECYFNKTAKYDSVHIQARRLFSFETYDVSENDNLFLKEADKGAWRLPILQNEHKNREIERSSFDPSFTNIKELKVEEDLEPKQNIQRSPEKISQNESNEEIYSIKKRMRRDVFVPTLVREGIMKITDGIEWTDDFLNKSSIAYQQVEEMVLSVIDSLFKNGPISSYFHGSYIRQFKKGSVIVLFSIEFKNDTNITHSDESINTAFHEALLNASAFTNLTLDVNNSMIGDFDLETTTKPATTTELATSSTSVFLSGSTTSKEIESTSTDQNMDSTTTQQPTESSTSTDIFITNTQMTETSTSVATETTSAENKAESTSNILLTLSTTSTTSTINEISTEKPSVISSSEEPSTTILSTSVELSEPSTSQTTEPLASSTEEDQSQIIASTTLSSNSASTSTAKSSTTTTSTTEAMVSTPTVAYDTMETSEESTETTTTTKEPHVSSTAVETPFATEESIVTSSTTELPISTITAEQPVPTTTEELPVTTSTRPPETTTKTEIHVSTKISPETTTTTDSTFTITNSRLSTTATSAETSQSTTAKEEQATTTPSEPKLTTSKIEVSTTTPSTETSERTKTKEEISTTTSSEPIKTTSEIKVSTTLSSIETPDTTTLKGYESTISTESPVTTTKIETPTTTSPTEESTLLTEEQTNTTPSESYVSTSKIEDQTTTTSSELPEISTTKEQPTTTTSTESYITSTLETQTTTTSTEAPVSTTNITLITTIPSTETPESTTTMKVQTTTPSTETPVSTSTIEGPTTTPSSETSEITTMIKAPTTTPSTETSESTTMIKAPTTTLSTETTEATSTIEAPTTTPSLEPPETTTTIKASTITFSTETPETTTMIKELATTPSTENQETTTTIKFPTTTPSTETPASSSTKEGTTTLPSTETLKTTTTIEATTTTSSLETSETTTKIEIPTTTLSTKTPEASTTIKVPTMTSSGETPETTISIEIPTMTSSTEKQETTTTIKSPTTTSSTETPETTITIEKPTTTTVTKTPEFTSTIEAPTTTPSIETAETTLMIKASTTTSSIETPETTTNIEIPTSTPSTETPESTTMLKELTTPPSTETPETISTTEVQTITTQTNIPETTTTIKAPTSTPSTETSETTTNIFKPTSAPSMETTESTSTLEATTTIPSFETPETTTKIEISTTPLSTKTPDITTTTIKAPTTTPSTKTAETTSMIKAPTTTSSTETPETTTNIEIPTSTPSKEITEFSTTLEATTTIPSSETPETTTKIVISTTTLSTETPETTSKIKEPRTTMSTETPETTSMVKTPTTSSSTKIQESTSTIKAATTKPSTETPETTSKIKEPTTTLSTETRESSSTIEVPTITPSTETAESTTKIEIPTTKQSTEIPETSTTIEALTTPPSKETQETTSTIEVPTISTSTKIPETTTTIKAPITTPSKETPESTTSLEATTTTPSLQTQETTIKIEIPNTTLSTETPETSTTIKESTTASSGETPETTFTIEIPTMTSSIEKQETITTIKSPTTTPSTETPETTTQIEKQTTTTASETPESTSTIEATTTIPTMETPVTTTNIEIQTSTPSTETTEATSMIDVDTDTPSTETPETTSSIDAPTTTLSLETPETTTKIEISTTTLLPETPETTSKIKEPTTTSSTETPETSSMIKSPTTTPSTETQESTSMIKTPTTTLLIETPESTSTRKAPTTTLSTNTPETTSTIKVPTITLSTETPESTSMIEAPTITSSTETPEYTSTLKIPTTTSLTETPESSSLIKTPTTTLSTETPESTSTIEAQTTIPSTETPESTSTTKEPTATTSMETPETTTNIEISTSTPSAELTESITIKKAPTTVLSTETTETTTKTDKQTTIPSTELPNIESSTTTTPDTTTRIDVSITTISTEKPNVESTTSESTKPEATTLLKESLTTTGSTEAWIPTMSKETTTTTPMPTAASTSDDSISTKSTGEVYFSSTNTPTITSSTVEVQTAELGASSTLTEILFTTEAPANKSSEIPPSTAIPTEVYRTTVMEGQSTVNSNKEETTQKGDISSTEAITLQDLTTVNEIKTSESFISSAMSTTSNIPTSTESDSVNTITSPQTAATDITSKVATSTKIESTTISPEFNSDSSTASAGITSVDVTETFATESTPVVEDISTTRNIDETSTISIPKTTSIEDEITKTFTSTTLGNAGNTAELNFSDTSEKYTTTMQLPSSDPPYITTSTVTNRPTDSTESETTVQSTTFTRNPINNTESLILTTTDKARSSTQTEHTAVTEELTTLATKVKSTTEEDTFMLTSRGNTEASETSTSADTFLNDNITSAFSITDMKTTTTDSTETERFTIEDNTNTMPSTSKSSTDSGSSVDVTSPVSTSGATESISVPEDSTTTMMLTRKTTTDDTTFPETTTLVDGTSSYPSTSSEMDKNKQTISTTEGKTSSINSETSSHTSFVSSLASINTKSTTPSAPLTDNQKTTVARSTTSENVELSSIAEGKITSLESSTTKIHSTNSDDITNTLSAITTGSSVVEEISDNTVSSSKDSTYVYKLTTPTENDQFSTANSPSSTAKINLSSPTTTFQSSTTTSFDSKMPTGETNSYEKTTEDIVNGTTSESADLSITPTLSSATNTHIPTTDKTTSTTHIDLGSDTTSLSTAASTLSTDLSSDVPSSSTTSSTYIPTENSPKFQSTDITHNTNIMTKIVPTTDISTDTPTPADENTASISTPYSTLQTSTPAYSSAVKFKTTTVTETSNVDDVSNASTDSMNTDSMMTTTDSTQTQTPTKTTVTETNVDEMTTIRSRVTDIQSKITDSSTTNIATSPTKIEQIQKNMTTQMDITPTTTTDESATTDKGTSSDISSTTTYKPTNTKETNTEKLDSTTTNNAESIRTFNTGSTISDSSTSKTQTSESTTKNDSFETQTSEGTKIPESIFTSKSSTNTTSTSLESQKFSTITTVILDASLKPSNETYSTENWFSTSETPSSKLFDTTSTKETATPDVSTTTEKASTISAKESFFTSDSTPTITNASITSMPFKSTTTIATSTTLKQEEPTTIQNLLTSMVSNVLTTTANSGKPTTLGILTTTTTKAPTVIAEEDEVAGVIKIEEDFDEALRDPTSDAYQRKVEEILALLQKLFANTEIAKYIANIRIEGFMEGSLIVKFKVVLINVHFDASYLRTTLNSAYYASFEPQYVLKDDFTQFSVDGGFETILGQTETTTSAIDHCLDNPCPSLATCKSLSTSYQCLCPEGYDLRNNQCQDVNECLEFPCATHFICNNTIGSYTCFCETGFFLNGDRCEDVNECLINDVCPQNSNCINLEGSYVCACNSGFTKKNDLCIDVNECEGNVCPDHSVCNNTEGSYTCTCETGFVSSNGVCIDNNECLTNVCPENSNCENKLGSYICFCKDGFAKNGTQCVDIDECSMTPNLCKENSLCTNTIGSFQCTCTPGYIDTGDSCKDINECDLGICPDFSVCTNTDGSYQCNCVTGYTMENATCIDIDECKNNVCPEHSVCKNTDGSYICTCEPGYVMTKGSCQDVDECISDLHSCPVTSTCMNTKGSYHCRCYNGYFQSGPQSCTESSIYNLDMRVQKVNGSEAVYSILLNDSSTYEFKTMAGNLAQVTDHIILDSMIHQGYLGTSFYMFEPGSIVSHGNLYYEPEVILSSTETELFAANSTSAYQQYSIELSELNLTDVDECLNTDLNDCSEYANCSNTPGKYNCTCFSQYLDISQDADKPGRICAAISDQHKDPILGLVVETDRTHYIASESANVTVRLSRGSHVTYNISYGDGSTERRAYSDILSFLSAPVFTHKYTDSGMYNLTVLAVNDISHEVQSVMIAVVDDIKNLNLKHTSTNASYDGQKRFELRTPKTLRHIKVAWDFGNGFEQQKPMSVFSSSLPLAVDHYYSVGNKFVRVNISNERTNQVIEEKFYIEEKISGLEVTCSSYITEPLNTLYLKVSFQTGSNVTVYISYGDGNKLQSVLGNKLRGEFTNYYPFVYSNIGKYNVSVRIVNTYSDVNITSPYIHVETPINNLLLSTGSVVALPPGEVKLLLSFTGSELEPCCMNCSTYIKGIFQQMDEIALINKDKPTEFLVVWQNNSDVGTADIEMLCKNKLGNQTFNTWTTFQRKIEQVYISTSQTSISVGGSITVKFDIGVGSHIQYQYDLGNGIRDSVNLPNSVVSNQSVSVTSSYQQMGVYEIKFNVSNLVSSVIKSVKVKVLEEIKGLKLSRYYKVSDLTETTHHGHGSDGDIFPLERPVIFEAVVSSGNEIIYTWKFGSENGYVTSDAKVMYKFQYVGSHLISVNVSNGLYFEYKEFSITLEEIVNPYSLKNNGPKMAFDLMTFTLKLSNPGTNPCYLWFMGDFSTIIIYGENVCREKAQLNNYEYRAWNVSNEIRHQHMYKTNGTFNVKVTGFNVVSSQSISNIGVITGVNCYYPVVHIIGGGQRIDEPVAMYRSEWINLESSAEINCPATSGPEYHWKIFKIQQGNTYLNRVFSSYDVNVTSTDHFKILFPPITFTPGLYRISLNVSMIGIPGMFSEHYTYLNITKTPLVVRISGGTARNIGYDSNLTLNAHEMTYDPDSPATSNFTFEWRCRKENEVFPSVIDYVTIPTRDEDLNQTRLSGCFGTGIGKLPISSGIIKVSTLFLDPHSKNVFEVYVRKDTREGTFQQTVEVTEGEAPLIQILCVENCNSKMNPSSQFSVQGKCLSCNLYEKVEYDWSLLVEESGEFQDVNELDSLLVTDTKSSVLVFKSSTLTGGRTYRLRLSASVYGYSKSFTEYEFITNLPPYGGSCGINPTSGYALETEFIISCNDWVNPGEEDSKGAGLLYRFWSKLRGRLDTQLLYYGTDPYTPDTTFPLGPEESDFLHDVVVRIANPIGEYVETWLSVKVSKPIIKNEVSELISLTSGQDSTLENLLSSGKTQEAKQVIVAVASLINTSPTEIGISRASVIKSNDKVISTTTTSIMTESTTSIPGTTEVSSDFPITAEYDNITTVMPTVSSTTPKATTLKITSTITTSTISTTSTEHLTTYIVGTTLDPAEVEAERQRKEGEEKKKRIQLRESLLTTLSAETTSLTMDSLQQTALCFRVVTHESSELSETSQDLAVKAMKDVANSFQKIVSQSQTDSTIQKYSAAEDILACLSSVIIAATGEELSEIQKINEKEGLLEEEQSDSTDKQTTTTTTTTPASNIGTTEAPGTTKSPEQIKLESKQKVQTLATKVFDVAEVVYKTIIQDRVPGEPPVVLESQLFTIVAERLAVNAVNNTQLDTSTGSFQMPEMDTILSQNTSYVDSKVLSSKTNPYVWDNSAKFINTPVLTLNLYDSEGQEIAVKNLNDNITIDISVDSSKLKISEINFPLTSREKLSYHFFTVRSNMSSVHIIVKPEDPETKLECYVGIGRQPTIDDYDSNFTIPRELAYSVEDASLKDELEHTIFLSPEYVQERGIGNYYLGVRPVYNETEEEEYPNYDDYYSDYGITTPWDLLNYTISFVTSGCFYWDVYFDKWVSDGCQVSYLSNSNYTRCLCNHLTSFGSDFFVPPNTINFMTVFNDFESKLRDNWAVLAVLCLMYFLYTVGLFWARYKDKRDVIKWGIAPLADNVVCDKFFYQLTVCTGMRRGAGTKSKISFVLAGETQDTGVRELIDEKGIKTCGRGSINNFVLSTSEWLGPLTFIRIWHDNTGEGKYQGWYLSKIIVTDLQTSETYCFLCNRWLAVEEDDGMIDRLLPVASKEDMTNFQNLFMTKTKKSFTDSHLWISVFSRPHRSTFTRVQRLSCILSLVMTTLMVNAMFYQAEDKVKNKEYLSFGPFEFSLSGIYISFVSSMIVLPVNIIIDQLFRKSKPKRNRITNAFMGKNVQPLAALSQIKLRPWSPPDETKLEDYIEKPYLRPDSANSTYSMHSDSALIEKRKKNSEIAVISNPQIKPSKKKSKKFMLPHSCVYVAYTLVYISALLSSFITFLYSIEWGKEKSLSWLSSILLSICESVIVIQPFKIILVAMLLSIILKKPDIEEETETSEESQMNNQLLSDEELLYKNPVKSERPALKIEPPDKEKLAEAREKRMKEIAMFEIVREIAFYFVFVALIVLVASHNRDKKAYQVKEALDNIISINKVNQRSHVPDFWNWLLEILLPRLYISKQWNNMPVDDNEKRMIATRVAYRVGPVRIRQQRVKQEECNAVPMMYKFIETCSQEWSVTMEDDATYTEGWKGSKVNQSTMLMNYPWKHRSLFDDAGLPFSGEFGIYTGGGYIADLIGDRERAMKIAKGLMLNNWINQYTRAIFIEFTVYNPYVNMFSNVFIAFEMPTMGKMMIKESVKTFRLFSYLGGYGVFVVLCELSTLAIVIYFIVREVKVIKQQRKKYFKSFWNCLEIFNMICAVVAVSMYIVRHMITQLAMHSVKKLRDKFYNFQKVAMWDEVFGYFMAFTIFVSIIKLLHLFRFNKRMSMIAGTLKYSTKELSAFSVVIIIVVIAFASWGYIMFGPKMFQYRNMFQSIETMLAFALGDFDYLALERVNRVFGPIYFFTFILCIMIVLLNVFVTILNESISAVKSDVSKQSNEHEIVAFIWGRFKDWVGVDFDKFFAEVRRKYMLGSGKAKTKEKAEDIEAKLRDISKRLEQLGKYDTSKMDHPPPDMNSRQIDDVTKELLFTRLFPTMKHQTISLH